MVTDRLPWSEAAAGWLRGALDAGLPILGVCYGHQLLAHALGGVVDYHPGGMELGTHEIFLHPPAAQEPELAGFPPRFDANLFHSQTVVALPPNTTVLAGSAHDPHQLLRYAPMVWSTQFHPEFDGGIMRVLVEEEKKRENPVASRANVADAPYAHLFLQRIVSKMVGADE
jgi:GMP synthase (glutamine-hydrolysing)